MPRLIHGDTEITGNLEQSGNRIIISQASDRYVKIGENPLGVYNNEVGWVMNSGSRYLYAALGDIGSENIEMFGYVNGLFNFGNAHSSGLTQIVAGRSLRMIDHANDTFFYFNSVGDTIDLSGSVQIGENLNSEHVILGNTDISGNIFMSSSAEIYSSNLSVSNTLNVTGSYITKEEDYIFLSGSGVGYIDTNYNISGTVQAGEFSVELDFQPTESLSVAYIFGLNDGFSNNSIYLYHNNSPSAGCLSVFFQVPGSPVEVTTQNPVFTPSNPERKTVRVSLRQTSSDGVKVYVDGVEQTLVSAGSTPSFASFSPGNNADTCFINTANNIGSPSSTAIKHNFYNYTLYSDFSASTKIQEFLLDEGNGSTANDNIGSTDGTINGYFWDFGVLDLITDIVGNREYTQLNHITNRQTLTDSIDSIDQVLEYISKSDSDLIISGNVEVSGTLMTQNTVVLGSDSSEKHRITGSIEHDGDLITTRVLPNLYLKTGGNPLGVYNNEIGWIMNSGSRYLYSVLGEVGGTEFIEFFGSINGILNFGNSNTGGSSGMQIVAGRTFRIVDHASKTRILFYTSDDSIYLSGSVQIGEDLNSEHTILGDTQVSGNVFISSSAEMYSSNLSVFGALNVTGSILSNEYIITGSYISLTDSGSGYVDTNTDLESIVQAGEFALEFDMQPTYPIEGIGLFGGCRNGLGNEGIYIYYYDSPLGSIYVALQIDGTSEEAITQNPVFSSGSPERRNVKICFRDNNTSGIIIYVDGVEVPLQHQANTTNYSFSDYDPGQDFYINTRNTAGTPNALAISGNYYKYVVYSDFEAKTKVQEFLFDENSGSVANDITGSIDGDLVGYTWVTHSVNVLNDIIGDRIYTQQNHINDVESITDSINNIDQTLEFVSKSGSNLIVSGNIEISSSATIDGIDLSSGISTTIDISGSAIIHHLTFTSGLLTEYSSSSL